MLYSHDFAFAYCFSALITSRRTQSSNNRRLQQCQIKTLPLVYNKKTYNSSRIYFKGGFSILIFFTVHFFFERVSQFCRLRFMEEIYIFSRPGVLNSECCTGIIICKPIQRQNRAWQIHKTS